LVASNNERGIEIMNYRLTILPALEHSTKELVLFYETKQELLAALNSASCLLLFVQDNLKVMPDYSNSFIQEEFTDSEWNEIDEN
jgi:hypothetical protein